LSHFIIGRKGFNYGVILKQLCDVFLERAETKTPQQVWRIDRQIVLIE
jgi:hypothetical protein